MLISFAPVTYVLTICLNFETFAANSPAYLLFLYSVQLFLKQPLKADYILSMFSYSPISKCSSSSVEFL